MTTNPATLRVGVIGMGRVGPAVASAMRANGHNIVAVNVHSAAAAERADTMLPGVPQTTAEAVVKDSDLVILAVPDGAIAPTAAQLQPHFRPGQVVVHLSGAHGEELLAPAAERGAVTAAIHPAMTFTGTSLDVSRLAGAPAAVTAAPLFLPVAHALATEIGLVPQSVPATTKPLYHAALVHASNHLVTVVAQASDLLAQAGVPNPCEYLRPLLQASLEGALEGGMGALTGPVMRGDTETVQKHKEALAGTSAAEAYSALSSATGDEWAQYQSRLNTDLLD